MVRSQLFWLKLYLGLETVQTCVCLLFIIIMQGFKICLSCSQSVLLVHGVPTVPRAVIVVPMATAVITWMESVSATPAGRDCSVRQVSCCLFDNFYFFKMADRVMLCFTAVSSDCVNDFLEVTDKASKLYTHFLHFTSENL